MAAAPATPRWRAVLAGLALGLAGAPAAAQALHFESCGEAGGASIAGIVDDTLAAVARAGVEGGVAVVRYNPRALPALAPRARLFFFAHECARHVLGEPLDARRSAEAVRRADCWALAALQSAGRIGGPADVSRLAGELAVAEADWSRLGGPARDFRFETCRSGALRLPATAPPSPERRAADRCVHVCGDGLWRCQKRCPGGSCAAACQAAFDACEAGCGGR